MTDHLRLPRNTPALVPDAMAETLAAYALDALPADERARVEAHLTADDDARRLLDEYRAVVDLLPYAAGDAAPPAAMRAETLARARAERRSAPLRLVSRGSRVFAAVAACLIAVALLWGANGYIGGDNGGDITNPPASIGTLLNTPGLISYEMVPEAIAPGATGRVYLTPDRTQMGLELRGMPPSPEGKAYQLWFRKDDQTRESISVFTVDASGTVSFVRPVPPSAVPYVTCGITQEPAGGSPGPTGSRVIGTAPWPMS